MRALHGPGVPMKEFIVNCSPQETRIALLEQGRLVELLIEREESPSLVGNIYKGRVDAVIPGMQAAFIDFGQDKNGFLYVSDIAGTEGTGDVVLEDGVPRAKTRAKRAKQQPIETMLKKNQYIMVQIMKDMLGTKGARLTNFITIPGRYAVLMPTVETLGVSRKIESAQERDRLKKILQQVRPKGVGLITRTAAEERSKPDLQADVQYLSRTWDRCKAKFESMKGPGLVREDLSPVLRAVRDRFNADFEHLIIDNDAEFEDVQHFVESLAPTLKKKIKTYHSKRPIFDKMGIEKEIEKALHRKVNLKSGGHICIDHTEALIAIDVNTGKVHRQEGPRGHRLSDQHGSRRGDRPSGPPARSRRHHRRRLHRHGPRPQPPEAPPALLREASRTTPPRPPSPRSTNSA
jgi:ribonuclease G